MLTHVSRPGDPSLSNCLKRDLCLLLLCFVRLSIEVKIPFCILETKSVSVYSWTHCLPFHRLSFCSNNICPAHFVHEVASLISLCFFYCDFNVISNKSWNAWVAQQLSNCLWLRAWSWILGSSLQWASLHGACFSPACVSASLSLCLSWINKSLKKR